MKTAFWLAALVAAACIRHAEAATVSEEMASRAVRNWRSLKGSLGERIGTSVADARRVDRDGAAFHVVRFEDGGFAVTPTDTTVRPVILFSDGTDLDVDDGNPAVALLVDELAARAGIRKAALATASAATTNVPGAAERAWNELLRDPPSKRLSARQTTVDDIRVAPLVQSRWSQGSVDGYLCFNYYTPSHHVCGCVATATAQIMRYLEYPTAAVASFANDYCRVDGTRTSLTAQGGVYDWSIMAHLPTSSSSSEIRQMIGKLTSDVGIGLATSYKSGGSSAYSVMIKYALEKRFGYSYACANGGKSSALDDAYGRVLRANLDAKLPVALAVPGHQIVCDGYGYIGTTLYYHLNFGWGNGGSTAWYAPPDDLLAVSSSYTGFGSICHNIYTTRSKYEVIASGRVTDEAGGPASGVEVWAENASGARVGESVTSDEHGIYAIFLRPGGYTVRAKRIVTDDAGRETGELVGATTANPVKCNTRWCTSDEQGASGTYTYNSGESVGGNAWGCDIGLGFVSYAPQAAVAFAGDAALGKDFASMTVPVSAQVAYFGPKYASATVVVTLSLDGTVRDEKSFTLADLDAHRQDVTFTGLSPGVRYTVRADVVFGTETQSSAENRVTAARMVRVEGPESAVLAAEDIVVRLRIDSFDEWDALPSTTHPFALSAFERADATGEFAVWDGSAWRQTGVEAELGVTNDISILRGSDGGRRLRLRKNGAWIDLGPSVGKPTVLANVAVTGTAEMVSLCGINADANRIGRMDGTAEYADLAAAIAAGETGTLTPLWTTEGAIPDDVRLLTLSIVDPNGLLTLTGGTLISTKTGSDGATLYCYGTADRTAVESSDYLKATSALNLANPIQATSEVKLGDLTASGGTLAFRVRIDDETVVRERVKDYVRFTDNLNAEWRKPSETEISVDSGCVTLRPESESAGAFVRVEIPKD